MGKQENVIGIIGIMLVIFGLVFTIPLVLRGIPYVYGLFMTGFMVMLGVILIVWAFSD